MLSRLLIVLGCVALGSCSSAGEFEDGAEGHARIRNPLYSNSPFDAEDTDHETDSWKAARATILKTFAFRALEQGLVDEARNYLLEACEADPYDTASHAALSRLYLAEGNRRSALAYATQAAQFAPQDPEVTLVYAAALAENDQHEEATRALERVWQVTAGDPAFARAMLTHYAATGGEALAKRFVEKVISENEDQAFAWALAGDVFLAEGDLDGATESYRKATQIDSNTPVPFSVNERLGILETEKDPVIINAEEAEESGDLEGAERLYRFLMQSKPDELSVHAGLARTLYKQERYEEAQHSLDGIFIASRTWRDHLLQAKIAIQRSDWVQAHSALLLTKSLRPGNRATEILTHYVLEHIEQERQTNGVFIQAAQESEEFSNVEEETIETETEIVEEEAATAEVTE